MAVYQRNFPQNRWKKKKDRDGYSIRRPIKFKNKQKGEEKKAVV